MKKVIFTTFIVIMTILVLLLIGYKLLPKILSYSLSKRAKVEVTINNIDLGYDSIEVEGIQVGNPKGSKLPQALKVKNVSAVAPIKNYFHDEIVIDSITLNDIYFGLEFYKKNSSNGNWTYIINNLTESNKKESASQKKKGKEKQVLIKKLILTNLEIEMYTHGKDSQVKKLNTIKRLEFTNVTSSGGIPTAQIMNVIIQQALREIFSKEGIQNMLNDILNPNQSSGSSFFKDLFSEAS